MSHGYKHFVVPGPRSVPLWLWVFALGAIGAFASLLVYLDKYEKGMLKGDQQISIEKLLSTVKDEIKEIEILKPKEKKSDDTENPIFDFYKMLPELKVTVPEHEATGPTPRFYLQAGSFKNYKAADRMKAKLALMGIGSTIESTTLKDTGRWHRVRVGPFTGTREMNKTRSIMRGNDIEPITVKVKT